MFGSEESVTKQFNLPPEDIELYRKVFSEFDRNKDGTISAVELQSAFRTAGHNPTEAEVQDMINITDTNNTGKLEWDEFANLLATKLAEREEEADYKETFRVFSKDDEGCITMEEMKFVLCQLCTSDEAEKIIEVVDRNGDGKISFSEFRCMMGANPILL
ncbi:neo-calmodulin [Eurytemora carolleeae]|uniref:neo-calmodulin n=1 Tax=Eurytemora carolleeae TaxID=1294199 RepID=UPI000C781B9A|nr:neo-calmodulin [Eurytemora carolleeae]|eukprot:XP_023338088.1 neo-calmodulin-like [Eurytemora affinis]